MKTWICKVCGYAHQGETPPERCPKCGAPKNEFYLVNKKRTGCMTAFALCIFSILIFVLLFTFCCSSSTKVDNSVVDTVDIYKYLGKWYEIARFDTRFEKGMQQCVATYSLTKDGNIKVVNRGVKKGKWKTSEAIAKMTDQPGVLRIAFWRPFYSDYRILKLAPDYSYALVGGDDDEQLWILSRTPYLCEDVRDELVNEAFRRGYDIQNLLWVRHSIKDKVRKK